MRHRATRGCICRAPHHMILRASVTECSSGAGKHVVVRARMRQKHLGHRRIGFPERLDQVGRVALLAGANERDGRALQQGLNSRLRISSRDHPGIRACERSRQCSIPSEDAETPDVSQRQHLLGNACALSVASGAGVSDGSRCRARGARTLAPARPVRPTRCT